VDKDLTKVIEDFDRAVLVEALCLAKRSGKHPLSESGDNIQSHYFRVERAERERAEREREKQEREKQEREKQERAEHERAERERERAEREREQEQDLLLRRLKPVETSYHWDLRCMDGTRQSRLNQITAWVTKHEGQEEEGNTIWIYGLPGIGKTSLAHSICAKPSRRRAPCWSIFLPEG
jgi:DNA replication protein DnaC